MADSALHIYFGSQTGTAEGFAHDLAEEALMQGITAKVMDLDEFSPESFATSKTVVMLVANCGEGEPTDNARNFHEWFMDGKTPSDSLAGNHFAVFGLGDREYVNFNHMGEVTDGALERLGAKRFYHRGVGDNSGDLVKDFQEWRVGLWEALRQTPAGAAAKDSPLLSAGAEPALRTAASVADLPTEQAGQPAGLMSRFYFQAARVRVARVAELRKAPDAREGQSTVHVELDISGAAGLAPQAAGTLELLPENAAGDLAAMFQILGINDAVKPGDMGDLECCITFEPTPDGKGDFRKPFPTPCTLREALTRFCDLRRAPTQHMLAAMLRHVSPDVRKRLQRLLTDDLAMRIVQDEAFGWTQHEFWTTFGVDHLDLGPFLLHCPRQRPRQFTVASSPARTPREVHLCASLASHPALPLDDAVAALVARGVLPPGTAAPERKEAWYGLCSQWLCTRLKVGETLLARVRPSAFQLVKEDVPLIMVGAGAGVAPFRAFWSELGASAPRTAPAALFFGCQHPDKDWIYRLEMSGACSASGQAKADEPRRPLTALFTAFSRIGEEGVYDPSGNCGEYVQDQLRAQAAELREWMAEGGVVYICGSNRMGHGVLGALGEVLAGGEEEVQRLRREGRIVQENWGEPATPMELAAAGGKGVGAAMGESAEELEAKLAKALLEAVKNGNHPEVDRLIAEGANVNFQADKRLYTRIGLRQEVGETALHWAALRGDDAVAEKLLEAKADPDLLDQDGKSALMIAAFNGVATVSSRLLSAKCDPNARDLRGNTALQWVILAGGSMRMLRLLLKSGARGDLANEDGELPADLADEHGCETAAELIRKHVAQAQGS